MIIEKTNVFRPVKVIFESQKEVKALSHAIQTFLRMHGERSVLDAEQRVFLKKLSDDVI